MDQAKTRIVLVDDSATVRQIVMRVLSAAGYESRDCATWEELQQLVATEPPDLVLLDVQMPHVSGPPMAFVLKQRYPDLKLVFYSSCDETLLLELVDKSGADGFIRKGPDYEQFLTDVASFLSRDGD